MDSITNSASVELNEEKNSVRRINNNPLPPKEEDGTDTTNPAEKEAKEAEKKELINFFEHFQPYLPLYQYKCCYQLSFFI